MRHIALLMCAKKGGRYNDLDCPYPLCPQRSMEKDHQMVPLEQMNQDILLRTGFERGTFRTWLSLDSVAEDPHQGKILLPNSEN